MVDDLSRYIVEIHRPSANVIKCYEILLWLNVVVSRGMI